MLATLHKRDFSKAHVYAKNQVISIQKHAFSFYFKVSTANNFMDASFN